MPGVELAPAVKAVLDALMPYIEKLALILLGKQIEKKDEEAANEKANLGSIKQQIQDVKAVEHLSGDALTDELLNGPKG